MARRPEADRSSETTEVANTKISDSGYSTACSNSQSQRSGSSKSLHSNSGSSNSSGYGGHRPPVVPVSSLPGGKAKEISKKKKMVISVVTKVLPQEEVSVKCENGNMETTESIGIGEMQPEAQFDEPDPGGTSDRIQHIVMAQAFQALSKLNKDEPTDDNVNEQQKIQESALEITNNNPDVSSLLIQPNVNGNDEFSVIVSMNDGKVLYSTPSLIEVLGFPKDMWLGRSIIDFIHKKDKVAFANYITSGVATPAAGNSIATPKAQNNTFFCCLRKYRGLKSGGFGVKDKEIQYMPFQLSMSFKESNGTNSNLFLIVHAKAVKTAYKSPDDTFRTPKFSTRQLSNCVVSEMDTEAVSYLGYLPQDIIGRSVFDFYHPEDTKIIKEMYEIVLEGHGASSRCKPYRFRAQNGEWVLLETEWSSFVNPWSRKLEFIIGQHSVLKGPTNPDVFAVPENNNTTFSDEMLDECKRTHDGIKFLLNESYCGSTDTNKQHVTKRCKDLAVFIKSIMDEITKPGSEKPEDTIEHSFSTMVSHEKDSVMLGVISPHHEGYSKSSSETPPSYSQLNYKENIARFFESKPKTTNESDETTDTTKVTNSGSSEMDNSGLESGPGSVRGSVSGSCSNLCSDASSNNKSKISNGPLTREILCRHNENMEKKMLQKHKKLRSKDSKDVRLKKPSNKQKDHGVKRCGSDSWEDNKMPKHRHVGQGRCVEVSQPVVPGDMTTSRERNFKHAAIWPPVGTPAGRCGIAGVIPVYYIPTKSIASSVRDDCNSATATGDKANLQSETVTYSTNIKPVPLINAFAMFAAPPLSCATENILPPPSQAKSLKPESGSLIGSRRMSECSKIGKSVDQEEDSPSMSQDEEKSKDASMRSRDTGTGDESCYSSSSSFNKSWGESESDPAVVPWPARPVKQNPPWMNDITVTSDLILRYQMPSKELQNVLESDANALKNLIQPSLIDEQLEQLYADLEKAGLSSNLKIDLDPSSTSSDSCGEENMPYKEARKRRRNYDYGQLDMIYEENMPLPPLPPMPPLAS